MANHRTVHRTIPALIEALGGNSALARALDLPPSTVGEMKAQGRIGVDYWPAIIRLARRQGLAWVSAEALMRLCAKREKLS